MRIWLVPGDRDRTRDRSTRSNDRLAEMSSRLPTSVRLNFFSWHFQSDFAKPLFLVANAFSLLG